MPFKHKNRKKLQILIIISIFLFLFCNNINNISVINNQTGESTDNFKLDHKNLRLANGWPKIHIDNNWSDAKVAGICTGSGTWNDPYMIKDKIIDGGGLGSCILIENTIEYFIIENCTVFNSRSEYYDAGIKLDNVNNGTLSNNNCSYCKSSGILLYHSYTNNVTGNICSNNLQQGIYLYYSYYNTVSENIANYNKYEGIRMRASDNNNVSGNIANYNGGSSINLYYSDNNTISKNILKDNPTGVSFIFGNNNQVFGNEINSSSCGINLFFSQNNNFSENKMNDCGFLLNKIYSYDIPNIIDNTNLVNDKSVYYYVNKYGLDSNNFTDYGEPGQVILVGCENSIMSNLNFSFNTAGFVLNDCSHITISNNYINRSYYGFFIDECVNLSLHENKMYKCGIYFNYGYESPYGTYTIDISNTVNNKPVYYYVNKTGLNSNNFTNAGQILLVNCNNSLLNNLNFSYTSAGIRMSYCENSILSNITLNYLREGIIIINSNKSMILDIVSNNNSYDIYLSESYNCTISQVDSDNSSRGIFLDNCYNSTISSNRVSNNYYGIDLNGDNNEIWGNNVSNNDYGINLNGDNNEIWGNNVSNNDYGILLWGDNNEIWENDASYNNYGVYLRGAEYDWMSNNTFLNNNFMNNNESGIFVEYGYNNTFKGNYLKNNKKDGIELVSCKENNITANFINNNYNFGINIKSSNKTSIYGNILNYNRISNYFEENCLDTTFFWNVLNRYVSPFIIDNLGGGSFTWIQAAAKLAWINGSGTYINPYIIEDLIINGENTSSCILIQNTYNYFIIRNCIVFNSSTGAAGIKLINVNNGIIINNTCSHHNDCGIYLDNSNSNTIVNNTAINNFWTDIYISESVEINITLNLVGITDFGILANSVNNTYITNNKCNNNSRHGIIITEYYNNPSINVTLSGNVMNYCGVGLGGYVIKKNMYNIDKTNLVNGKIFYYYVNENGLSTENFTNPGQIYLANCNYCNISDYNISYGSGGIALNNCSRCFISKNNFSYHKSVGVSLLYYANNNTISNNILDNNIHFGLNLWACNNNKIKNNIISNTMGWLGGYPSQIWNGEGINFYETNNNFIFNNTLKNNLYGIKIEGDYNGSNNNTIIHNYLNNNSRIGILIKNGYNNSIYNNVFNQNQLHAYDNGSNNIWDDGFAGNYWEDYIGVDADNDGIGDSFYSILGDATASDTRPLIYQLDIDTDGDGLTNYEEYTLGLDGYRTNVTNPDSDYDGLSDYWEWLNGTNPWESDTDFDGMPDYWEVNNNLNPLINDAMDDPDIDQLENIYEFHNGTNPHNPDTDADTFLDGVEVDKHTNPLNRWWYPMPNLAVLEFEAKAIKEGEPFTLNFTIINNGIWRAENVIIMIRLELLNLTLYSNIANPIDLEVNEIYQDLIQCTGVEASGGIVMEIVLDPFGFINETYSNQDGSLRANCEGDNSKETELQITGIPKDGGGIDPFWIIFIIIGSVVLVVIISAYIVMRPRLKRKSNIKKQIENAKADLKNFEINIRSFIKAKLMDEYHDQWWEKGIPSYIRETIESKIKTEKTKKLIDKMDYLDFTHYNAIITNKDNWENIFSDVFREQNIVEKNFENLRIFKSDLYSGDVTLDQLHNYPVFIHTIRNYFTKAFNIFLSYSTLDTDYFKINDIVKRLQSYPEIDRVFFWELDSGENIVTFMERTLKITKVFLLFCTENALNSKAVEDEWQAAFQLRKKGLMKIVPVYEKEEFIPYLLMPLLNVKFTKEDFDGFIQKLYEEILR